MVDSAARVCTGARQIKQIKDAGRRECWAIREPEDADMRRSGVSSVRAGVVESTIYLSGGVFGRLDLREELAQVADPGAAADGAEPRRLEARVVVAERREQLLRRLRHEGVQQQRHHSQALREPVED